MDLIIDIETIPDQTEGALQAIEQEIEVKCPRDLTKPKLMELVGTTDKYKTVPELKEMWVSKFGEEQKKIQAEKQWRDTALDGSKGEICAISFCDIEGKLYSFIRGEGETERHLLDMFWLKVNEITENKAPYFIAHNAKFDLPFIYHRSVINKIRPNDFFKPHGRHGSNHYCTMEAWSGFNGRIGLNRLAKTLGEEQKTEGFSGADVYDAWLRGDLADIVEYCNQDVIVTKNIYKRLKFI